jgi:hypothetical protein
VPAACPGRQAGQSLGGDDDPHALVADRVPSAVRASAISFTDLSVARMASTRSRRLAVLRGPLGLGLEEAKNSARPARRSVAIWYIVAFEYPKRAPASSAGSPSTK